MYYLLAEWLKKAYTTALTTLLLSLLSLFEAMTKGDAAVSAVSNGFVIEVLRFGLDHKLSKGG